MEKYSRSEAFLTCLSKLRLPGVLGTEGEPRPPPAVDVCVCGARPVTLSVVLLLALVGADEAGAQSDDDIVVQVTAFGAEVVEGQNLTFRVSRTGSRSGALTVGISVSDAGGYVTGSLPTSVSLGAGRGSASFTLATDDDSRDEVDGTVEVTLESSDEYTVSSEQGAAAVTVRDDDLPLVAITTTQTRVKEGNFLGYRLTRSETDAAASLTVNYEAFRYPNVYERNYQVVYGRIEFDPGETFLSIGSMVRNDSVFRDLASVAVRVDASAEDAAYRLANDEDFEEINVPVDDEDTVYVSVEAVAASVSESSGCASFRFNFTNVVWASQTGAALPGARRIVVPFAVEHTDLLDGPAPTSVTIPINSDLSSGHVLCLPIADDEEFEQDGSVALTIRPPSSGDRRSDEAALAITAGQSPSAQVTVVDDDELELEVEAGQESVAEGRTGVFVLRRNVDSSSRELEVVVRTSQLPGDFNEQRRTVTFPEAESAVRFSVQTVRRPGFQPGSSLGASILLAGGLEYDGVASLPIVDLDPLRVAIEYESDTEQISEMAGDPGARFSLSLADLTDSSESIGDLEVEVNVRITQTGNYLADSTPRSRQVILNDSSRSRVLLIPFVDDDFDQRDGSITVTIEPGDGYIVAGDGSATIRILDDDEVDYSVAPADAPVLAFFLTQDEVTEGSGVRVLLQVTEAPDPFEPFDAYFLVEGDTKIMSRDTAALVGGGPSPDFGHRVTSGNASFELTTEADNVSEGDGEIRLTIVPTAAYRVDADRDELVGKVIDDDRPGVSLEFIEPTVSREGDTLRGVMFEGTEFRFRVICAGDMEVDEENYMLAYEQSIRTNHPLFDFDGTGYGGGICNNEADPFSSHFLVVGPANGRLRIELASWPEAHAGLPALRVARGCLPWQHCPQYWRSAPAQAEITIVNRNPTVGVYPVHSSVQEGEHALFALVRQWNTEGLMEMGTTVVNVRVSVDGDYVGGERPTQVTFLPGEELKLVSIPTDDDQVVEEDGLVVLEVLEDEAASDAYFRRVGQSSVAPGTSYEVYSYVPGLAPAGVSNLRVAAVTIVSEDRGAGVTVAPTELRVREGASASYTVVLNAQPSASVSLTVASSDSNAVTVSDTSLTFSTGDWNTPKRVTVTARQDENQVSEQVTISNSVSGPGYSNVAVDPVSVTVVDDDALSTAVELFVSPSEVTEGETAEVTVTGELDGMARTSGDTVVDLIVHSTEATVGLDYRSVLIPALSIPEGQVSGTTTFSLDTVDDDEAEGDEAVVVLGSVLDVPTLLARGNPTITILDNDKRDVLVSRTILYVEEGGEKTYTVALASGPTGPVTVTPALEGSSDVSVLGGALTFTANDWSMPREVRVRARPDRDAELDTATISHAVGGGDYGANGVSAPSVSVVVVEDQAESMSVLLSLSPESVEEGIGTTTVDLSVRLDGGALTEALPVTLSVGGGTAAAGRDFVPVDDFVVTVAEGTVGTSASFDLQVVQDSEGERNETVVVSGTVAVSGVSVTPASLTILDDDERGAFATPDLVVLAEGQSGTYELNLKSQPSGPVTVTPSVTGDPDVTVSAPVVITAADWRTSKQFTVSAAHDSDLEYDEATVSHSFAGGGYAEAVGPQVTVSVTDDDQPPVTISANQEQVQEGEDAVFTLTRGGETASPLRVNLQVSETREMLRRDHRGRRRVEFPAGASTVTFVLQTLDDLAVEHPSNVRVAIQHGNDYDVGSPSSAGTLVHDNEQTLEFSFVESAHTVSESEGTLGIEIKAITDRDVVPTLPVAATVESKPSAPESTAVPGEDFGPVSEVVVVDPSDFTSVTVNGQPRYEARTTVNMRLLDDELAEEPETIVLRLGFSLVSLPTFGVRETIVTIVDDDPAPTIASAVEFEVDEGETAVGQLSATDEDDRQEDLRWSLRTGEGQGADGAHFAITRDGRLSFTEAKDYEAPDDSDNDGFYVVTVQVSDGTNEAAENVLVTLRDLGATVGISGVATAVEEGADAAFTVTRSGDTVGSLTAEVAVAESGAMVADDQEGAREIEFSEASTSVALTVETEDDDLAEAASEVTVTIAVSADYDRDDPSEETVLVNDNDGIEVSVSAGATTVAEGNSAVFTVSLSGGTHTAPVVVTYSVTGTATAGTSGDYTAPTGTLTIDAEESSGTITIATLEDTVLDPGETIVVTLTGASTDGEATFSTTAATVTITDGGMATASIAPASSDEGEDVEFTVSLSGAAGSDTVLAWSTSVESGDTATSGDDFTAVSDGTLTIMAGETSETLSVSTKEDTLVEASETFTVTLSVVDATPLPDGVALRMATATGTITNDDSLEASVSADPATVAEGGTAKFPVSLTDGTSTAPVVVAYSVGGTATRGAPGTGDYTGPAAGTLTIDAEESSGTITIATLEDTVLDPGETIVVTLTGASTDGEATFSTTAATVTITDGGMATASIAPASSDEGEDVEFTVSLSGAAGSDTVLAWSTSVESGDTATSGDDFTAVSDGTLTIMAGETSETLSVSTKEDTLVEASETFTVTLSVTDATPLPDGVALGTATATGTITDDDSLEASVTADPATVAEGGTAKFPVSLTGGERTAPVVVAYSVGGTATRGEPGTGDYTGPAAGTLTIDAEDGSGTITIATLMDTVLDPGETIVVTLTGASTDGEATFSTTAATVTITDGGMATASIAPASSEEGEDDVEFTVSLSGAAGSDTVLAWSTSVESGDTATSGDDFTAVSDGTLTIMAGETSETLSVSTKEDTLVEASETFTVTLAVVDATPLPDGVALGTATATGTITDDDSLEASVSADPATVAEGGAAKFPVSLTGDERTAPVVVAYSVGGTATRGAPGTGDYTGPAAGTLTIDAEDGIGTITIATLMDTVLDPGETIVVTLTGASTDGEATFSTTAATVTITDGGMATVSIAPASSEEGEDDVEFTVSLSGAAGSDTVLAWSTSVESGDTATSGDDFTAVSDGTLTIMAGETSETLSVSTKEDTLVEASETFTVTLAVVDATPLPDGVALGTATATGTITDDDSLEASVTADPATVAEGGAAKFPVSLTGGESTAPVVVAYSVGGTATQGAPGTGDYTGPAAGTLTIDAEDGIGTITIATLEDTVLDPGETIVVTLTGASTDGEATFSTTAATVTITDGGMATASIAPASSEEGEDVEFTVSLSGAAGSDTVLAWSTSVESGDTATSGDDFTAVSDGTLTIMAGETSETLSVSTKEDTLVEASETFTVTLAVTDATPLPDGVALGTATATGTITDDDSLEASVTADPATVAEGGAAKFPVSLTGDERTAPVVVAYSVGGTATRGAPGTGDYTGPAAGTLTIDAEDGIGTITIATLMDTVLDPGETIVVTLTGASTDGEATFSTTAATVTITDGGMATVSIAPASSEEGEDDVEFTVSLSGAAGSDTVLAWSTSVESGDTATSGDDFTAVSDGTLTIMAGETSETLSVSTKEDTLVEASETFTVTLAVVDATPLPDGVALGTATATGTITDDDSLEASVTADPATVAEGGAAKFPVSLTGDERTAPVVVAYSVGGTATRGAPGTGDYTGPAAGTLTIDAEDGIGTITITTLMDTVLDPGETIVVTLTGASTDGEATFSTTAATVTITDGGMATASIAPASSEEGEDDVEFTVSLSGAAGSDTVLAWSTSVESGDTATSGDDFTAVSDGTLTIMAGETSETLSVSTKEDTLVEASETFTVTLSVTDATPLPDGVALGTATATGTITDDDSLEASVTADPATVAEGGTAKFPVSLTGGERTAPVVVAYSVGGTATRGEPGTGDYTGPAAGTLTIDAEDGSGTITIATLMDTVLDPGETIVVTLTGASTDGEATFSTTAATVTITDGGMATASIAPASSEEGEDDVEFTVSLSGAAGSDTVLAWSTSVESGDTATSGDDFTAVSDGMLTIMAGETSETLSVSTKRTRWSKRPRRSR